MLLFWKEVVRDALQGFVIQIVSAPRLKDSRDCFECVDLPQLSTRPMLVFFSFRHGQTLTSPASAFEPVMSPMVGDCPAVGFRGSLSVRQVSVQVLGYWSINVVESISPVAQACDKQDHKGNDV